MDDNKIIELYFARDERAISETKASYGKLLLSIANGILGNMQDSEECENDTYLRTWNAIPPTRPVYFSAFLSKITRNVALNRLRENKQNPTLQAALIFEELSEALPDVAGDVTEDIVLRDALNSFIAGLDKTKRLIFIKRYFYMMSIKDVAYEADVTVGTAKVMLSRTRKMLRKHLTERGIVI